MKRTKKIILVVVVLLLVYSAFVRTNVTTLHSLSVLDPLFYDPLIDTKDLALAVTELRATEQQVRNIIEDKASEGTFHNPQTELDYLVNNLTQTHIVPIHHLELLPDTIVANREFHNNPNLSSALTMLSWYSKSADAYRNNAEQLERNFEDVVALEGHLTTPLTVRMFASLVDSHQQRHDIRTIVENGKKLQQETRKRWLCLLARLTCTPTNHTTNIQKEYVEAPKPIDHETLLTPELALPIYSYEHVHGPYTVETGCYPDKNTPVYITIDNHNRYIIKSAKENYYYDIALRTKNNAYSHLAAYEHPYYFQNESNSYRCLDFSHWFDSTALLYLDTKHNIHATSGELDYLSQEAKRANNLLMHTAIENKLWKLPQILRAIDSYLYLYGQIYNKYSTGISATYLLAVRSSYGVTYQAYTKSIWRLPEQPRFFIEANTQVDPVYKTYSDLIENYSEAEMQSFHTIIELEDLP